MDSLSLFNAMRSGANPIGAYAQGAQLANQMLQIQAQQGQQVFENLFRSAQQAESRRQFEESMAFRRQELADQSARGWFNAETQRMAYDPNRGAQAGPPISAMQPQVTDLGNGLVSVRKATRDGFQDQIFQVGGRSAVGQPQQSAFPPGISFSGDTQAQSAPQQQSPTPPWMRTDQLALPDASIIQQVPASPLPPMTPNPPIEMTPSGGTGYGGEPIIDSSTGRPVFDANGNYILGNEAPGETGGGDPETYGAPIGGMVPTVQSGATLPPQSVPDASVIIQEPVGDAFANALKAGRTLDLGAQRLPEEMLPTSQSGQGKQSDGMRYPDYIQKAMPRLQRGEVMSVGYGEMQEQVMLGPNGQLLSRTLTAGRPIPEWNPYYGPGVLQANPSDAGDLEKKINLLKMLNPDAEILGEIKMGDLLIKTSTAGKGGERQITDPTQARTPGQFALSIGDEAMRERLAGYLDTISNPGGERGDTSIREAIAADNNIEVTAVTPQQVESRKSELRMQAANGFNSFAASYYGGKTPWGGTDGLLEQLGMRVTKPATSGVNKGGTESSESGEKPKVIPLPKTLFQIEREKKVAEAKKALEDGWRSVQENFESRLLRSDAGKVRYTEDQLDAIASGIYQEPPTSKRSQEVSFSPSYGDRILSELGLGDVYPAKRPVAKWFTTLRSDEVARAWAKDRLMRSKFLDPETGGLRQPSSAAQQFNSDGAAPRTDLYK